MNNKHTCYYCTSSAAYVSVRDLGRDRHTYYFYCERHKTPTARPLAALDITKNHATGALHAE